LPPGLEPSVRTISASFEQDVNRRKREAKPPLQLYVAVLSTTGPFYLLHRILERKCRLRGAFSLADGDFDRNRTFLGCLQVPGNIDEAEGLDCLALVAHGDFQLVVFLVGLTTQVEQETAILLFSAIGRAAREGDALPLGLECVDCVSRVGFLFASVGLLCQCNRGQQKEGSYETNDFHFVYSSVCRDKPLGSLVFARSLAEEEVEGARVGLVRPAHKATEPGIFRT